jgi:hypothetical protein
MSEEQGSIEYRLAGDTSGYRLREEVGELLNSGWRLVGGVAVNKAGEYVQALTKEMSADERYYRDETNRLRDEVRALEAKIKELG